MSTPTTIPTPNPTSAAWSIYIDSQPFNLTALDGSTVTISLSEVNAFIYYILAEQSVQGFIIGISSLLIIVLLLLTTAKKARRLIFIFNFLSVFFLCFRSIFNVANDCTALGYGIGEVLFGATAQYPFSKYAISILGVLVSLALAITIVVSLVLQVRVVFAAEPRTQKIVTAILTLMGLWTVGSYFAVAVWEVKLRLARGSGQTPWTYTAYEISMIIYTGICSLLFLYKLFHAIRLRRRMGYKNFGPLQILFVMFAQCLVIPSNIPSVYIINCSGCVHSRLYYPTHQRVRASRTGIPRHLPSLVCSMGIPSIRTNPRPTHITLQYNRNFLPDGPKISVSSTV